jgi:hypothetical protein
MLWALSTTGQRIKPAPGVKGVCPICGTEVLAKTGYINIWHFSHRSKQDCDNWSENESAWHYKWKSLVPEEMQEVVIKRTFHVRERLSELFHDEERIHRADIHNSRQTVIELQHSPLTIPKIQERENFYINLVWLFDFTDATHQFFFKPRDDHETFTWRRPKRWMIAIGKPLFLDFGGDWVFLVKRLQATGRAGPFQGWGYKISKDDFKKIYFV